ncbi:glycoside hydrolase family 28 protein [Marinilactibacillus sp. XAAS-LB27]|uniref:glycoside hydrolase family 28 protein n=1 Tax=Marinilactibacillus sp. XAAS-LB27 TaxID=3114538 RepID=UPI002E170E38|nr:glycoside hydrolase family 28 protein [Marinilactibacillus sp. XAAS-LB27]
MYSIKDFGAKDDGTLVTEAIDQAIQAAKEDGGGTILIPSGTYVTGSIRLYSHMTLHLSPGAVLKFSTNQEDYPVVKSRWEGVSREVYMSCVYGDNVENVTISGSGTLDGNGADWWDVFRNRREELLYPRPKLISFEESSRITIKDVMMIDSPSWTINPIRSSNITIDNVSILNPADSPNTDGIDPESCSNVRISNCNIDVGDDCIAIKSGTEEAAEKIACENITITNCTMSHGHGGVVLGSEMSGDIRNVVITNCVFKETDRGIRLKSRRGRGGTIEDIRVSNIVMESVLSPFILNLYYFCGPKGKEKYVWDKNSYPVTEETPKFRRIHFANITARNVRASAGFLYGLAEQYLSEITFENIDISMTDDAEPGVPAMMTGIEPVTHQGFYIGNVKDASFRNITIENHKGPAFYMENCQDIEIHRAYSKNTKKEEELVVTTQSSGNTNE